MTIALAGRVLDDQGRGINGASVSAYPNGSATPDATTVTANDGLGQAGYWSFASLGDKQFYVQASFAGKVRQLFGPSEVQLNRLIIGARIFQVDPSGNTTLRHSTDPGNGAAVSSPLLKFTGAYDSDAGAGVTVTEKSTSLANVIAADGSYHLSVGNDSGTEVLYIDSAGNLGFQLTGSRILADFSNATLSSRVMFQDKGTNNSTLVGILPNGTSNLAVLSTHGASDPNNASYGTLGTVGGTAVTVNSGHAGGGTTLPLNLQIDGTTVLNLSTTKGVYIGDTPTDPGANNLKVQGSVTQSVTAAGNVPVRLATFTANGTTDTTCTFASIPSGFRSLAVMGKYHWKNAGQSGAACSFRFNNDAGANYDYISILSGGLLSNQVAGYAGQATAEADFAGRGNQCYLRIGGYSNTSLYKTVEVEVVDYHAGGDGALTLVDLAEVWKSTVAINRIDLFGGTPFGTGTYFDLWGYP